MSDGGGGEGSPLLVVDTSEETSALVRPPGQPVTQDAIRQSASMLLDLFTSLNGIIKKAEDIGAVGSQAGGDAKVAGDALSLSDEDLLRKVVFNKNLFETVFPVYGGVKAGKSTFMASLLGDMLLPAQGAPMTSIPIRIKHTPGFVGKTLTIPHADKWNDRIADFKRRLLAKSLHDEVGVAVGEGAETNHKLYETQEAIRSGTMQILPTTADPALITQQLNEISHFVRLLWINDIDSGLSMELDNYPSVEMSMAAFENQEAHSFSFLDTPGGNEAKAMEALQAVTPRVMATSSGCIFCIPHTDVSAKGTRDMYQLMCKHMMGKRVIVVVTRWDSQKDDLRAKETMRKTILNFFHAVMRSKVTVLFTSGLLLYTMNKLKRLLMSFSSATDSAEIRDALRTSDFKRELFGDVDTCMGYLHPSCDETYPAGSEDDQKHLAHFTFEHLNSFADKHLTMMQAGKVLDEFRVLYAEAETIAITGHVATLDNVYQRWLDQYKSLDEFVRADDSARELIQKKLEEMKARYEVIRDRVCSISDTDAPDGSRIPGRLSQGVDAYLKVMEDDLAHKAELLNNFVVRYGSSGGGPKRVIFVLDYSGSMSGVKINSAVDNMLDLFDNHTHARDHLALYYFTGSGVNVAFSLAPKDGSMRGIINSLRSPPGGTNLYDAVLRAREDLDASFPGETSDFIIVVADGQDGSSACSLDSLVSRLRQARPDGSAHPACIILGVGADVETGVLTRIAQSTTKGQYIFAEDNKDAIKAAFSSVISVMNAAAYEGSFKEDEEIDFIYGKGEMDNWLEDTALPALRPYVDAPTREALAATFARGSKTDIYSTVLEPLWKECKDAALEMAKYEPPGLIENRAQVIMHHPVPTVEIDFDEQVKKVSTFDTQAISYIELGDRCTIVNALFKDEVLTQFRVALKKVAGAVKQDVLAGLTPVFDEFKSLVTIQAALVETKYLQNKAFLENQIKRGEFLAEILVLDAKARGKGDPSKGVPPGFASTMEALKDDIARQRAEAAAALGTPVPPTPPRDAGLQRKGSLEVAVATPVSREEARQVPDECKDHSEQSEENA